MPGLQQINPYKEKFPAMESYNPSLIDSLSPHYIDTFIKFGHLGRAAANLRACDPSKYSTSNSKGVSKIDNLCKMYLDEHYLGISKYRF